MTVCKVHLVIQSQNLAIHDHNIWQHLAMTDQFRALLPRCEQLRALHLREQRYPRQPYPKDSIFKPLRPHLVQWIHLTDQHVLESRGFRGPFLHTPAAFAVSFLDDSVTHDIAQSKQDYILVAIVAFQLSYKLFDRPVSITYLLSTSDGLFDQTDFNSMESKLLEGLKWNLHPPTAGCFLNEIIPFLPGIPNNIVFALIHFMSCDNRFIGYPVSSIACGGIWFVTGYEVCPCSASILDVVELLQLIYPLFDPSVYKYDITEETLPLFDPSAYDDIKADGQ